MLDSQEETDVVLAARRRCRSFDSLPRDGSETLLLFVDDGGGVCDYAIGQRRTYDRQLATGGNGDVGRCLSASDLLTAVDAQQGDDYDPSWCSVNNLETDCVSPRVSSNSLFSQLDAGTAASSDEVGDQPASSSYHLTAADVAAVAAGGRRTPSGLGDDQPMYTRHSRRIPLQTAAASQQTTTTFLLRQLTTAAGGGAPRPAAFGRSGERRSSMVAAPRSSSCPSLVYAGHQQTQRTCPMPAETAEHGVTGGQVHASRNQLRAADRLAVAVDEALAPVSIIAHSTGCGSRSPMVWLTARPSRSTSPPTDTAVRDRVSARRLVDDGARKTRQRGVGGASAMTTGRATQKLARTKCLQWLNSFDEDD